MFQGSDLDPNALTPKMVSSLCHHGPAKRWTEELTNIKTTSIRSTDLKQWENL